MNRFYAHFKADPNEKDVYNGIYEVIGTSLNENGVIIIHYRPLSIKLEPINDELLLGNLPNCFSQPRTRFNETVYHNGTSYERFTPLSPIKELINRSKELYGAIDRNNF